MKEKQQKTSQFVHDGSVITQIIDERSKYLGPVEDVFYGCKDVHVETKPKASPVVKLLNLFGKNVTVDDKGNMSIS